MKPTRLALLAAAGMFFTSVSVYSLTPPGGFARRGGGPDVALATAEATTEAQTSGKATVSTVPNELSRFTDGKTLTVDGRVGNPRLSRTSAGETFVMLEVRPADGITAGAAAPVNLSLVIDRSGSMKGTRIRNAIAGAVGAVERLNDGDVVSVVTFDTQTQVVVPATTIGPGARERINAAIRGIGLGGDTCISCGIEEGMRLLAQTSGKVNRIILLSDGDANHGVRDVPGFRGIAQRAQGRGVSVTTIGVDVDYNEKIMAAIAQDSNGRHYFVADDSGLARVFEDEAQSLTRAVASNAEVAVELAPGVELDRVFDRSFRRAGNQIIVPLGTFAGPEVKTVLLKVRVPHDKEGAVAVAGVDLAYRDLVDRQRRALRGQARARGRAQRERGRRHRSGGERPGAAQRDRRRAQGRQRPLRARPGRRGAPAPRHAGDGAPGRRRAGQERRAPRAGPRGRSRFRQPDRRRGRGQRGVRPAVRVASCTGSSGDGGGPPAGDAGGQERGEAEPAAGTGPGVLTRRHPHPAHAGVTLEARMPERLKSRYDITVPRGSAQVHSSVGGFSSGVNVVIPGGGGIEAWASITRASFNARRSPSSGVPPRSE